MLFLLLARGAIDWKLIGSAEDIFNNSSFSYSLGNAIDWKLKSSDNKLKISRIPYSLGDAIDWKRRFRSLFDEVFSSPTR
ncbi:hypothetical protein ABRG53_1107 [Pseudanabaena sp. ABRG5-3]|nr:hypothetical protein ABRG53_1107 [Pseudanabaena sp. ABRG5-3]